MTLNKTEKKLSALPKQERQTEREAGVKRKRKEGWVAEREKFSCPNKRNGNCARKRRAQVPRKGGSPDRVVEEWGVSRKRGKARDSLRKHRATVRQKAPIREDDTTWARDMLNGDFAWSEIRGAVKCTFDTDRRVGNFSLARAWALINIRQPTSPTESDNLIRNKNVQQFNKNV